METGPETESETATNRIVRWEVLAGLPSEGPMPKYFHLGHPTPWSEGFVVRFWNQDGTNCVGNFQSGWSPIGTVLDWPEATIFPVIAYGACYFVAKNVQHGPSVDRRLCYRSR